MGDLISWLLGLAMQAAGALLWIGARGRSDCEGVLWT